MSATKFGHTVIVPDLAGAIQAEPRANRGGSLRPFRARALQPGLIALRGWPMTPIFSIAGCVLLFVGLCAAVVNLAKDDTSVRR